MRASSARWQRGGGKIGAIIGVLVLVTIGYLIVKWVPVRTQKAEMTDFIERATRRYAINELKEEQLIQLILDEGKKDGLQLEEGDVRVDNREDKVIVSVRYTAVIHLIGGKEWPQKYIIESETKKF